MAQRGRYDDIIGLQRPAPLKPPMTRQNRAAQFSPFAALTGYDDAIRETARLTEERVELDESRRAELDAALGSLRRRLVEKPPAAITYFVYDAYKAGGAYVTARGALKAVDPVAHAVLMADGTRIPMEDIVEVTPL